MPPSQSEVIAQQTADAIAAGGDPLGDNDPIEEVDDDQVGEPADDGGDEQTKASAAGADADGDDGAAAAAAAGDGDDGKPAGEAAGAAEGELSAEALEAVAAGEPPLPVLNVDKTDFAAERAKLTEQEQAIEDKWTAGDITDGDRNKQMAALRDQRDDLTRRQTRAETLDDMNRQQQMTYQTRVLRNLAEQSKKAGQLDYHDPKVGAAFDRMLSAVAGDPENEGKSYAEVAQLAHDALCAVRGVKTAAVAAAPAAAPAAAAAAARKPPAAPVTLRNLPAAATPNTGGDALQAISNLKGQAYQDAFARLSPAQKAELLDEQ